MGELVGIMRAEPTRQQAIMSAMPTLIGNEDEIAAVLVERLRTMDPAKVEAPTRSGSVAYAPCPTWVLMGSRPRTPFEVPSTMVAARRRSAFPRFRSALRLHGSMSMDLTICRSSDSARADASSAIPALTTNRSPSTSRTHSWWRQPGSR